MGIVEGSANNVLDSFDLIGGQRWQCVGRCGLGGGSIGLQDVFLWGRLWSNGFQVLIFGECLVDVTGHADVAGVLRYSHLMDIPQNR